MITLEGEGLAQGHFIEEMVQRGLITRDQLTAAEMTQRRMGGEIPNILIKKGFVREQDFLNFIASELNMKRIEIDPKTFNRSLLRFVPYHIVQKFKILPIEQQGKTLVVAVADPFHISQIKTEWNAEGFDLDFVMAPHRQIENTIRQNFQMHSQGHANHDHLEIMSGETKRKLDATENVEEMASSLGTVAAVDSILRSAIADHASDVHLEPQENYIRVRFRIDGVLEEKHILPCHMLLPIVSRIKIVAGMNIAERRAPQDGRFSAKVSGELLDCRTSTYPTVHGEKVVIRLLSKSSLIKLEQLGLTGSDREVFRSWISKPHGMILVTGPTGSGKSTTLAAALQLLNSTERNIMSIEDPVENEIPGVNQAQLCTKANITFASALRSMLRQDPDVIMLGEIRDAETADMALRAALTGHLVLSTLHTNTALGAVTRLSNLGIPPFLVSSALIGVLGQRLVRKICSHCSLTVSDTEGMAKLLGLPEGVELHRGKGCEACRFTGYSSRIGIFELLSIKGKLRELVEKGQSEEALLLPAREQGYVPLFEDGKAKVLSGLTTVQEVVRVTEECE